jgi:colicin import membrane protein
MTARNNFLANSSGDFQAIFFGLVVSIFFHTALVVVILFSPGFKSSRRIIPDAMTVNLVALSDPRFSGPSARDAGPPEIKPEPAVVKKTRTIKSGPAPVSPVKTTAKIKPVVKRSMKKKTFKTGKVVEKAVREMEKQVAEKRPDAVKKAIDRIREKDAAADRSQETETQEDNPEIAQNPPGGSANPDGGKFDQIDLYKLEVKYRIQKNWAYSEQLAGRKSDLESLLVIQVMPDGEIKDVWFERKSGNPHLDDSAYKAVLKSNPLPPLPVGFNRPFFTVGMIFTPAGLQ